MTRKGIDDTYSTGALTPAAIQSVLRNTLDIELVSRKDKYVVVAHFEKRLPSTQREVPEITIRYMKKRPELWCGRIGVIDAHPYYTLGIDLEGGISG